jgi:hypothetical protein
MSMRPSLTRQYIRQVLLSGPALLSVSWALPARYFPHYLRPDYSRHLG